MMNSNRNDPFTIEEIDYEEMFSEPTLPAATTTVNMAADDALAVCINVRGCVDLIWMSEISGISIDSLTETLGGSGIIFQLPEHYDAHHNAASDWVLHCQYLIGNIRDKIRIAERMNRKYHGRFQENVRALKAALPIRVPFEEIGIQIGSPLISPLEYALFAQEAFRLSAAPEITHSQALDTWKVTMKALPYHYDSVYNTTVYGTRRMNALEIFEHSLNGTAVETKNKVPRPDRASGYAYVINKDETLLAQEKQQAMEKAFLAWCADDPVRKQRIEERFNDTFVRRPAEPYDGSFLQLADLDPSVHLYRHQKNAVARIVLSEVTILCWSVGSGKTFGMIAGLHELYRIGLSKKNPAVVPNVMIGFFAASHHMLFPDDEILVVGPEDFRPQNRQHVLEQIRDGDFAVVYIAFSCFNLIHMSREYYLGKKQAEVREYAAKARTSQKWEKRRLENLRRRALREYRKMDEELPPDEYLPFDALGITTLAIDELHNYKYSPPDRRFTDSDFLLPAYNITDTGGSLRNLWICIDTSASISDRELVSIMSDVLDAVYQTGMQGIFSFFDTRITEPAPFEDENDLLERKPIGGGGTSFHTIFGFLSEHMDPMQLPKAILVFTDGYASCPDESESAAMGIPVFWLITKGGRTDFPFGIVAELN